MSQILAKSGNPKWTTGETVFADCVELIQCGPGTVKRNCFRKPFLARYGRSKGFRKLFTWLLGVLDPALPEAGAAFQLLQVEKVPNLHQAMCILLSFTTKDDDFSSRYSMLEFL